MKNPCYDTNMTKKNEDIGTLFGEKLKEIRQDKGYTQTRLAEISGVSQRVIEHYEKYAKRPSIDKVKKIAAALNVSDDELLGTLDRKKKKKDDDLSFKLMKKLRIVEQLPTRDQNTIFSLINALAEKNKAKGK